MNATLEQDPYTTRFYGKYRAVVSNVDDPEKRGRIRATVADVLGTKISSTWALPCVPMAAPGAGVFVIPPVGAFVWVEFEQGDVDYPIWTGGFWGESSDVPKMATSPEPNATPGQNIVLQTSGGQVLAVSDASASSSQGGIVLKSAGGAMIVVNDSGIYLDNGQGATVWLKGSEVAINQDALTVR
jgi:uncharacterized protein involved in type VI secretion and phage assembly